MAGVTTNLYVFFFFGFFFSFLFSVVGFNCTFMLIRHFCGFFIRTLNISDSMLRDMVEMKGLLSLRRLVCTWVLSVTRLSICQLM